MKKKKKSLQFFFIIVKILTEHEARILPKQYALFLNK